MSRSFTDRIQPRTLLIAVLAGVGFAMTEMVIEAFLGKGFWAPLRFIASVFTLGKDIDPSFALGPVLIGAALHMMESVIFGAVFIVVISRVTHGPISLGLVGVVFGAILFAGAWFVALPLVDPAMLLLSGAGFLISHMMFGLLLGLGSWLVYERIAETAPVAA
jgi:hypothetical protein